MFFCMVVNPGYIGSIVKQDDRLGPAYFWPNCKYFDRLLQTVKNETVLRLIFKGFSTNINSTTDFYNLCKRGGISVPKNFVGEPFGVSENFGYRKILCIRGGGGYYDSPSKSFCVTVPKHFVEKPF